MNIEKALERRDELDEDFGSGITETSPEGRKKDTEADKEREEAKKTFLAALEADPSLMLTTAGSNFEGWRITEDGAAFLSAWARDGRNGGDE